MTVLEFKRPEPKPDLVSAEPDQMKDPHQEGEAFCMGCNHTWVAVAPVGALAFECPSCHCHKGHFKFECGLAEGTGVWTCKCDNQLFNVTEKGIFCPNCGIYQVFP